MKVIVELRRILRGLVGVIVEGEISHKIGGGWYKLAVKLIQNWGFCNKLLCGSCKLGRSCCRIRGCRYKL